MGWLHEGHHGQLVSTGSPEDLPHGSIIIECDAKRIGSPRRETTYNFIITLFYFYSICIPMFYK